MLKYKRGDACEACGMAGWQIIQNRCHSCGHEQGTPTESRPHGFGVL